MGSKEMTRQWLSASNRREQLLRCALKVAAQRGLGRTGHTEIAREAGVAVSSVFLYFSTRQALRVAIVEEVGRYYIDLAHTYHNAEMAALEAVHKHFYAFADSVNSHPEYAQIWLEWAVLIRNEDGLWDLFLKFQEQMIRIIAASIRRCQSNATVSKSVPAADAARLLVASAYTTTQLRFMKRSNRMVRRYTEQALKLALHQ